MKKFIKVVSLLKWIGLLGFPIFFSDWVVWKFLWMFWLFAILEIILIFPMFIQALGQFLAVITVPIMNRPLTSKENYNFKVKYSLPFKGEWLVVNGGIEKNYLIHGLYINKGMPMIF